VPCRCWVSSAGAEIIAAREAARQAVSLDANDAFSYVTLGFGALFTRNYQDSLDFLRTALNINPNMAAAYGIMATTFGCMGNCDSSLDAFSQAVSLSLRDPTRLFWMSGIGISLIIDHRYDEAVDNCRNMMQIDPNYGPAHRQLCSALALAGLSEEARQAMATLRKLMPELTISKVEKMVPVMKKEDNVRWLAGLREAGLPD
jgi:tetratricopeptide (TPR) repeat protein